MSQHTRYIGINDDNERLFAIVSDSTLPPPLQHARLIATAPEMYRIIEAVAAGTNDGYSMANARALLREIEGE
mgnify:CR=1 FL=1